MRTTVTIDDQLAEALKRNAQEEGKSFKDVVNESLRAGLHAQAHPGCQAYHLEPTSMGSPQPGYDLLKARQLSDELEELTMAEKLEQRK